ncbi:hypothetical protein GGF32_002438 [Allomyces javanicus]|nr:hypothetical protein GGF32_002438 [Allomyces javanicus]
MSRQGRVPAPPPLDLEDVMNVDDLVSDEHADDLVSDEHADEITHDASLLAQHGLVAPNNTPPTVLTPNDATLAILTPSYAFPMTATPSDAPQAIMALNYAFPAVSTPTLLLSSYSAASSSASSTYASPIVGIGASAAVATTGHLSAFSIANQPSVTLPNSNTAPPVFSPFEPFTPASNATGPTSYAGILSMPAQVAPGASTGPVPPAASTSNAYGGIPQPIPAQPPAGANSDPALVAQLLMRLLTQLLVQLLTLVSSSGLSAAALLAALSGTVVPPTTYTPVAAARLMDKTHIDPRNHDALDKVRSTSTEWIAIIKDATAKKRKRNMEAPACEITLLVLLDGPDQKPLAPAPLGHCLLSLTYVVAVSQLHPGGNTTSIRTDRYELPVFAVTPVVELPVVIPRIRAVGEKQVHVVLDVTLFPAGGEPVNVTALPTDILCESRRTSDRHKTAKPGDKDVVPQMDDGTVPSPTAPAADLLGPVLADISESEVKDLCGAIERLDPVAQIMGVLQTRRAATHMARFKVLKAVFCAHMTVESPGSAAARPDVAWTAEHLGRVVAWVHNEDPAGPSVWTDATIGLPLDFVARQCHDPAWLRAIFDAPLVTPTAQAAHTAALRTALKLSAADSWMPMHRAVFHDNVEFLIHAARIDTDHAIVALRGGFAGKTFLHLLAGRDDAALTLCRLFADADFLPRGVWKQLLEAGDSYGVTPLRAARFKAQDCGRLTVRPNVAALHEMEVAVGLQGVGLDEGEEEVAAPST